VHRPFLTSPVSPLERLLARAAAAAALVAVGLAVLDPPDAVQGQWQRLMYLHVPAAWAAYLCFAGSRSERGAPATRRPSF